MARRKKGEKSHRRFLRLWTNVKRSEAYYSLSVTARAALIELLDRYTGINNGMIVLGARELADELRVSKDTAARALRELDDAGLARPVKPGVWRGRRAAEWRLTFYRCDVAHELPVTVWAVRPSPISGTQKSDIRDTKPASVRYQGRKSRKTQ